MALKRIWTPSGSYSSGGTKTLLVIHTMEGFTGSNGAYDCAKYFQGNVGASSQVCIDNNRGTIWECVSRSYGAWTQCQYNSRSISCEQSGYASWSRQYWLDNRSNQLHNIADWLAEESAKTGIPLTDIGNPDGRGVIYHMELGSAGCGHSDPGYNWPIDKVLEWARGGTSSPQPPQETGDSMVSVATDPDGDEHYACLSTDGKVMYMAPGWGNFSQVDPKQSGAKSGVGITIGSDWWVTLSYTNGSSKPCKYRHKYRTDDPWGWSAVGNINAR